MSVPLTEARIVAKKRTKDASPGTNKYPVVGQVRGSAEYKEWLESAAAADERTVASFLRRAAAQYAQSIGYKKKAPER